MANPRISLHGTQPHSHHRALVGIAAEEVPAAVNTEGLGLAVRRAIGADRLSPRDDLKSVCRDRRIQRRGRSAAPLWQRLQWQ